MYRQMEKVNTAYGEMTVAELVVYAEKWKRLMEKHNALRHRYNQTEEGKIKNREKAKSYYERNRDKVLEKRRAIREKKKDEYKMLD